MRQRFPAPCGLASPVNFETGAERRWLQACPTNACDRRSPETTSVGASAARRSRRPFRMYKFRTMVADAERGTGPVWATDGDPRITRLGAILRSTHLDEVPQFLNVLRGEMSIVGPRPERPALVERLAASIPGYEDRCAVLPGITGLAQVRSGYDRSIGTVRRKLRYDRYYIRRRGCLSMDLRIMTATFMVMCQGAFVWR